ncbi:MAG: 23S ribosomal RNA methyltransferase Erm [Dermatophilaceae bacterium]
MPTYRHGRHEHGQNFLHDRHAQLAVVDRVRATSGPILEIGGGSGALTDRLVHLGRPLTVVEIDRRLAGRLAGRHGSRVEVVHGDFLHHRMPPAIRVLVGNLPFHQTTAMLRHVLHAPGWTDAVLLVQWEVARRRAGVGGSTLMTAQWSPWFTFELGDRVPARSFIPAPGVDGGILTIRRRAEPLLPARQRKAFQAMAHTVFTGPGRGVAEIVTRAGLLGRMAEARRWATIAGLDPTALPRELRVDQWVGLFRASRT